MEQETSNSSGSDGSPVWTRRSILCPLDYDYNLEKLHKNLLLHLKKQKNIPRKELKSCLEQISKLDPQKYKNRWLLKKVQGILKYILKKRCDFTDGLLNGEIEIYATSLDHSQSQSNSSASASPSEDFPMRMLTNNNFMSPSDIRMEVDNCSLPSTQSLSSNNSTQELHNFAQENYRLLKSVVAKPMTENLTYETDDYVFKRPHPVQKVFQMHESLEENFNSIVSLASSAEKVNAKTDEHFQNLFDDFHGPNSALNEYREISSDVREWVTHKFISKLPKEIEETHTSQNSANSSLSLNQDTGSVKIKPLYTEANCKTIKEICEKFKERMKNRNIFDFLNL